MLGGSKIILGKFFQIFFLLRSKKEPVFYRLYSCERYGFLDMPTGK